MPFFYPSLAVFMLMTVGSEPLGWMANSTCLPYIGCNAGFFGYDAATHFVSGIMVAGWLGWQSDRRPEWEMLGGRGWIRDILTIVAVASLVCVLWELLEYSFDAIRISILHIDLTHPNQMAQASNADTMGDFAFGILGALFASMAVHRYNIDTNKDHE